MFRGLGANTKSFKSYGKSKTNTKNQHKASWASDSDDSTILLPRPVLAPPAVSSDEDSTTDEEDRMVRKKSAGGRKGALEIIRMKRDVVGSGKQVMKVQEEEWSDQENAIPVSLSRKSTPPAGESKKVVASPVASPQANKKSIKPRRKRIILDSGDEEEEIQVTIVEQPRTKERAKERTIVKSLSKSKPSPSIEARTPPKKSHSSKAPLYILQDPTTKIPLVKPLKTYGKVVRASVEPLEDAAKEPGSAETTLSSEDSGIDLDANLSAQLSPTRSVALPIVEVSLPVEEENVAPAPIPTPEETEPIERICQPSPAVSVVAPSSPPEPLSSITPAPSLPTLPIPAQLLPILAKSTSPFLHDFSTFTTSPLPPFAPSPTWKKLGEASYSEVFSVADSNGDAMVIKIIPIALGSPGGQEEEVDELREDLPYSSECSAVLREIGISQGVGEMEGFVNFRGVFIVQGDYPTTLLAEWDRYKISHTADSDEQIRPDVLPSNQIYAMICLAHGGSDLESYKLRTWQEAASVLYQVADICAKAEKSIQFEHRDLHWGNVLVRPTEKDVLAELANLTLTPRKPTRKLTGALESSQSGVEVTLIDFTLSRANLEERVVFDPFVDECIFDGEGDEQFDVYRSMRDHIAGDWEGFHPLTNLMWLHYLSIKLLNSKKLKIPPPPPTAAALASLFASPTVSPARARTVRSSAMKLSTTSNRRARTMPIRKSAGEMQRDRAERSAYEGLAVIEQRLREMVFVEVVPKNKGRNGKGRKAKVEVVEDVAERWKSAGEFVRWWKEL